jgi:hypothetical protein
MGRGFSGQVQRPIGVVSETLSGGGRSGLARRWDSGSAESVSIGTVAVGDEAGVMGGEVIAPA